MFDEGLKGPLSFVDVLWSGRKAVASARARVNGSGSDRAVRLKSVRSNFCGCDQINLLRIRTEESVNGPSWPPSDVRNLQTAVHSTGPPSLANRRRRRASYLPLRISCCLMFFMKWIFLKLFGRGEPERVRHLEQRQRLCQWGSSGSQRSSGPRPPRPPTASYLRRGAFSSMSSSVSSEER